MDRLHGHIRHKHAALTLAVGLALLLTPADAPARDWRPLPGDTPAQDAPTSLADTPPLAWRPLTGTHPSAGEGENAAHAPTATHTVTVQPGDTLGMIARREGLSVSALARLNGLAPPYTIFPGQKLALPSLPPVATAAEGKTPKGKALKRFR